MASLCSLLQQIKQTKVFYDTISVLFNYLVLIVSIQKVEELLLYFVYVLLCGMLE